MSDSLQNISPGIFLKVVRTECINRVKHSGLKERYEGNKVKSLTVWASRKAIAMFPG